MINTISKKIVFEKEELGLVKEFRIEYVAAVEKMIVLEAEGAIEISSNKSIYSKKLTEKCNRFGNIMATIQVRTTGKSGSGKIGQISYFEGSEQKTIEVFVGAETMEPPVKKAKPVSGIQREKLTKKTLLIALTAVCACALGYFIFKNWGGDNPVQARGGEVPNVESLTSRDTIYVGISDNVEFRGNLEGLLPKVLPAHKYLDLYTYEKRSADTLYQLMKNSKIQLIVTTGNADTSAILLSKPYTMGGGKIGILKTAANQDIIENINKQIENPTIE
ncbi:hypothetical protein [Dyadobacter diqingensis]|uniref:hypothetical protein n=1 Tax=Dyadobacter diqingensis TaxID=2938121 RepID=UPI0020C1AD1F|nr:hypothetical protein [Dyadobacter diqingensis]